MPGDEVIRRLRGRSTVPGVVLSGAYLRVDVAQLRDKLGDAVSAPRFIATEPGFGYR